MNIPKIKKSHLFYTLFFTIITAVVWYVTKQNGWEGHLREWLNLLVRWTHVIIGIAWIGASFYFIFLENSLNRTEDLRDELAGNLWAVHGGGFYYVEKYKLAPQILPKKLHWFKYEAYFTWLSGITLLTIVYYSNANLYLIDPAVRELTPNVAVAIGIGGLVVGWYFYDLLCKTPIVYKHGYFALIMSAFTVVMAYFFSQMFSGRAAYIHVGAMMGTWMAGNVFYAIIPAQKAMVKAAEEKLPLDPTLGKFAGLRSLHNNYFTLPVVFIMVSNHFPSTYGNASNWLILSGLFLASVGVRHYLNLHEKGQEAKWILPIVTFIILGLAYVTAPPPRIKSDTTVSFAQVAPIFEQRCVACHSATPTDDIFTTAPKDISFDTPLQIQTHAETIMQMAVLTEAMPLGNKTGMLPAERELLRLWINNGAPID